MAITTSTSTIIRLPDELQQATLSHLIAQALVRDLFLNAPEWHDRNFTPPLESLLTIAHLSAVCTLWRQLVFSILRRALSPIGSIPSPVVDPFPLWIVYGNTLRHLQAGLRDLRSRQLDSYRGLVPIPHQHQHQHQHPLPIPILTVGTPPSSAIVPIAQTPPLPPHNHTIPSAPFGGAPGLSILALAAAPNAIAAVAPPGLPHSTTTPLLPTTTTMTPTTATNTSIPFFSVLELHARADVFRRTYRGSGKLHCRVDQSLAISKFHAVDALAYIHQARALIDHLNIDELGIALNRVLQETEDDVALGLRACEWQETLHRLCTFPPWDQQAACEVYACLLEVEHHVNAASLPLLQISGLGRMINITSSASHILPVLVGKELIDCRAKAHNLSVDWMFLLLHFNGYF